MTWTRYMHVWYGTVSGPGLDQDAFAVELTDNITENVRLMIVNDLNVDQRVKYDGLDTWVESRPTGSGYWRPQTTTLPRTICAVIWRPARLRTEAWRSALRTRIITATTSWTRQSRVQASRTILTTSTTPASPSIRSTQRSHHSRRLQRLLHRQRQLRRRRPRLLQLPRRHRRPVRRVRVLPPRPEAPAHLAPASRTISLVTSASSPPARLRLRRHARQRRHPRRPPRRRHHRALSRATRTATVMTTSMTSSHRSAISRMWSPRPAA